MKRSTAVKGTDFGTYGAFFLYASTAVATPMALLPMAQEFSLSFAGGGAIEAARSLLILVMLLYSGYAASRWGKIRLLSLGMLMITLGLFSYALSTGYVMVLAAMGCIGLGGGLVEALVNPLVQDLHPDDAPSRLNHVNAFFSLGVFAAVLIAGEILTAGFSWRFIFVLLGIIGMVFTLVFSFSSRGLVLSKSSHSAFHIGQILKNRRFWILGAAMFLGGALESAFTFWSASYVQVYFDVLPRAGGIGTACFAGGMAAGRLWVSKLARTIDISGIIMRSALLGCIVGITAYFVTGLWVFFLILFTAGLSVACYWPSIQAYAASTMKVDSTLLFIYLSCFGIPGFGITPVIMGAVGDRWDLQRAFLIVPVFSLLLLAVTAFDRRHMKS